MVANQVKMHCRPDGVAVSQSVQQTGLSSGGGPAIVQQRQRRGVVNQSDHSSRIRRWRWGRRNKKTAAPSVATRELPRSPGPRFYDKLNALLTEAEFDALSRKAVTSRVILSDNSRHGTQQCRVSDVHQVRARG